MVRMLLLFIGLIGLMACKHEVQLPVKQYQTQYVILVMIDGARYSETWGDSTRINIPVRDSLAAFGVVLTHFRNDGVTYTVPGHTAVCTGNYQSIANDGTQLPNYPSIFQYWLKHTGDPSAKCCIVASKDKLYTLSNCLYTGYHDQYRPYFDCGVNGNGTGGYRADSITLERSIAVLNAQQPKLMLIAFKDPDYFGHQGDYPGYINAIRTTDQYVGVIWNYIQNSSVYKDKTTLIVTNDHGRHLDGVLDGFAGHGDNCEGCRQIEFFALSPDFKQNAQISTTYGQQDISATIGELMHFSIYTGKGKVMAELFK